MGTCSITYQAHGNPQPVSYKYKPEETLSTFKSQSTPSTDYSNVNRSLEPLSIMKPIRRRDILTSIQYERALLLSERKEFERDKKIQEIFRDGYGNSMILPLRKERGKK